MKRITVGPSEYETIWFGKYKGMSFDEAPTHWLKWMTRNRTGKGFAYECACKALERRGEQ